MKEFTYVITDPVGFHARPAGVLAKQVKGLESKVVIWKGDKSAEAKKLMAVMGLGVKQGDLVKLTVEGEDEDAAALKLKAFLWENF